MGIEEITFLPMTYLIWQKEIEIKNIMDRNMWQTVYGKAPLLLGYHFPNLNY